MTVLIFTVDMIVIVNRSAFSNVKSLSKSSVASYLKQMFMKKSFVYVLASQNYVGYKLDITITVRKKVQLDEIHQIWNTSNMKYIKWNKMWCVDTQVGVSPYCSCVLLRCVGTPNVYFFSNFYGFLMNVRLFLADFRHLQRLFVIYWSFLPQKYLLLRHLVCRHTS